MQLLLADGDLQRALDAGEHHIRLDARPLLELHVFGVPRLKHVLDPARIALRSGCLGLQRRQVGGTAKALLEGIQ